VSGELLGATQEPPVHSAAWPCTDPLVRNSSIAPAARPPLPPIQYRGATLPMGARLVIRHNTQLSIMFDNAILLLRLFASRSPAAPKKIVSLRHEFHGPVA